MAKKRSNQTPEEIALERIAECRIKGAEGTYLNLGSIGLTVLPPEIGQLSSVTDLGLYYNKLTTLPSEIGQLKTLVQLDLDGNQLTTLPPEIGQLVALTELSLNGNQLTTLPPEIGQLKTLTRLGLAENQLTTLPSEIGQLIALTELYLDENQFVTVPPEIGKLIALTELHLHRNQLTGLPPEIGQLKTLRQLRLDGNRLTMLPPEIGQLKALTHFDLDENQLTMLPPEIGQLIALSNLYLSRNQLTSLPPEIRQLAALKRLYLHHNPKLALNADVLGPMDYATDAIPASPRAILDHYFGQQKRGAKRLNEVKILLVGHGRVGKTSLSKALRGVAHNQKEPETPGIERHPLTLHSGKTEITAHVWDFGGQEFLHQTHQFFFSERSIYIVVLMGRDRSLMQRSPVQEAEYWLKLIRTYGTSSPVVIVLNKFKAHSFSIDEFDLKDRYPEVKAVVQADCDPHFKINEMKTLLGTLANRMPGVREKFDPAWARVRETLETIELSFVEYEHYQRICTQNNVNDPSKQESLATILNCLGIALNYRNDPRLRHTSVLKPRWLVDGIYAILRRVQEKRTDGELRKEDFALALKDKKAYPPDKHEFLLDLMEKFELCFPLPGRNGSYLVPGLLGESQPIALKEFMSDKARRIQFRYDDVRPPGLMPQFIVRSHTLSVRQPRWLRGVVLTRGKARALVKADHDGRLTDVYALGDDAADRIWLTEFIVAEMKSLHAKLPVHTLVESEVERGAWTELDLLREASNNGEKTRVEQTIDRGTVELNIEQTLREVESVEASRPQHNPLPLFICYAQKDERIVKQLKPSLTILARRGYIAPWHDIDLVPGEDWDETIQERLSKSRVILFMVSRQFLASKYVSEKERPFAMKLHTEKRAVIVPIILTECSWRDEDFAKLQSLPQKNEPVSSFSPRENAWHLVEQGLMKAIKSIQDREPKDGGVRKHPPDQGR